MGSTPNTDTPSSSSTASTVLGPSGIQEIGTLEHDGARGPLVADTTSGTITWLCPHGPIRIARAADSTADSTAAIVAERGYEEPLAQLAESGALAAAINGTYRFTTAMEQAAGDQQSREIARLLSTSHTATILLGRTKAALLQLIATQEHLAATGKHEGAATARKYREDMAAALLSNAMRAIKISDEDLARMRSLAQKAITASASPRSGQASITLSREEAAAAVKLYGLLAATADMRDHARQLGAPGFDIPGSNEKADR